MAQRLVFADQAAELLAGVDVGGGEGERHLHGAHHVGADGCGAGGDGGADGGCGACMVCGVAQGLGGGAVEHQFAGRRVVDQAEATQLGAAGVDQEERQAVFVTGLAAHACAHHEATRRAGVQHERLDAVEAPLLAIAARTGLDPQGFVAPRRFVMRPGHAHFALGQGGQQAILLRFAASRQHGRRSEHAGGQVGFEQQRAAKLLHDRQSVARAAAQTAEGFWNAQGCHAQFGQLAPGRFAPASGRVRDGAAILETVVVVQQAREALRQRLLVFVQIELHGLS
ncbi:hypothetical protein D9M72_465700 [compost metagenome]